MGAPGGILLFLALALAVEPDSFPEMAACMAAGNDTQLAINFCSARSARVEAARLAMAHERIGWMGDETKLDLTVKAFAGYKVARCNHLGSRWEGGSGQPMIIHGCTASTTLARAQHLEDLLNQTSKNVNFEEEDRALNITWKAVSANDKELLHVQRQWLGYRDAQCDWEETRLAGSRTVCMARLTKSRTAELAGDVEP